MGSETQLGTMNQSKLSDRAGCDLLHETALLGSNLCNKLATDLANFRQLVAVCRIHMLPCRTT